jgi:hypothetical protein
MARNTSKPVKSPWNSAAISRAYGTARPTPAYGDAWARPAKPPKPVKRRRKSGR